MLEKVRNFIEEYKLISPEDRVIIGFSGGIDSVCLLHLLYRLSRQGYNLDLWAVYINHSLRPAENIKEEELLAEVGSRWQIKTKEFIINIPERLKQKPQSLQVLAREERYRLFESFRQEIKADKIALAHHQDDQVETILYRLIRGTGIDGLAGIPVQRDNFLIRPLLGVNRTEIFKYVSENNLSWVEDSSNKKTVYQRNKIRLDLLPAIKQTFNPHFDQALLRLSRLAQEQHELMEDLVNQETGLLIFERDRVGIRLKKFQALPGYLQYYVLKKVLLQIKPYYQIESTALFRLREGINNLGPGFNVNISKGYTVYYETGTVYFQEKPRRFTFLEQSYPVNFPGVTPIPDLNLEISITKGSGFKEWGKLGSNEIYIDGTRLAAPLKIRFWQPGDSFRPFGANGTQKLHDFFINQKINRELRSRIPLLVTADNRIVWIIGYRMAEEFRVSPESHCIWYINVKGVLV